MGGTITVGALCTGYGGLEMALRLAGWPVELAWVADNDKAAARLLKHHHPEVPNLGDITTVDWQAVKRPDVLTAGFPCTDISCAGRMAGMGIGTRSGVWAYVVEAIAALRPGIVVIENVEALLSTHANRSDSATDGDMEPGAPGVGDGSGRLLLRALGAVLGDLADLGFDAEWTRISAASVGAPHRRNRIFILAWPADAPGDTWRILNRDGETPAAVGAGPGSGGLSLLPTPNAALGRGTGFPSPITAQERMDRGTRCLDDAVALLPTPAARDADRGFGWGDQPGRPLSETVARLLPTPKASDGDRCDSPAERNRRSPSLVSVDALLPTPMAADGDRASLTMPRGNPTLIGALLPTPMASDGGLDRGSSAGHGLRNVSREIAALLPTPRASDGTKGGPNQRGSSGDLMLPSAVMLLPTPTAMHSAGNATANRRDPKPTTHTNGWTLSDVAYADRWGQYAPAIARWEAVLGRPAPSPTEPGAKGQPRLSPLFVEWLMGLPEGHVTAVPDLKRNEQLARLGNGIVPLQGAAGVRELAARVLPELTGAVA